MTTSFSAQDERDLGTFIESALDDLGLEMHEFRAYARISRRAGAKGKHHESVPNAAAACRMSDRMWRYAVAVLVEARMIRVIAEPRGKPVEYGLTPRDRWVRPAALETIRAKVRKGDAERRPRHTGALLHDPSDLQRTRIFSRDQHTCRYCGNQDDLTIDHVLPRGRGGKTQDGNLVTACSSCNERKNSMTPEEAGMVLRPAPGATPAHYADLRAAYGATPPSGAGPATAPDAGLPLHGMPSTPAHHAVKGTPGRYSLEGTSPPTPSRPDQPPVEAQTPDDGADQFQDQHPTPTRAVPAPRLAPAPRFGSEPRPTIPKVARQEAGIDRRGLEDLPPAEAAARAVRSLLKGHPRHEHQLENLPRWLEAHPSEYIIAVVDAINTGKGVDQNGMGLLFQALNDPANQRIPEELRTLRQRLERGLPGALERVPERLYLISGRRTVLVERWTPDGEAVSGGTIYARASTRLWELLPEGYVPDGVLEPSAEPPAASPDRIAPERVRELKPGWLKSTPEIDERVNKTLGIKPGFVR